MDLKNGILDVHGFLLTKDAKLSDFYDLPKEDVKIKTSRLGSIYIKFLHPLHSNGIDVTVEVSFYKRSESPKIVLWPAVPSEIGSSCDKIAKYKVEASKKWLKGLIDTEPDFSSDSCIYYKFAVVKYYSSVIPDPHYGLIGGEIQVIFTECNTNG